MELTDEQKEAIEACKALHGRTWKSKLRQMWMYGNYDDFGMDPHSRGLQQVRNQFGPTWLINYGRKA